MPLPRNLLGQRSLAGQNSIPENSLRARVKAGRDGEGALTVPPRADRAKNSIAEERAP